MTDQRSPVDMTPDELCAAYRDALRGLYGDERADASRIDCGHGWYYVNVATRWPDGSFGTGSRRAFCVRKADLIDMIGRLWEAVGDE